MPDPADALDPPYHRAAFERLIDEIEGYLAELRYIDKALPYLSARHDEMPGTITASMEITLGETYPFTRLVTMNKTGLDALMFWHDREVEQVTRDLEGFATEARQWASTEIATFVHMIRPITNADTGGYYEIDRTLAGVHLAIVGELSDDLGALGGSIEQWYGDAARAFKTKFYHPFGAIRFNQANLVTQLRNGLASAKAITDLAQHSLMRVATHTRKLLRDQLRLRSQGSHGLSQDEVLLMVFLSGTGAVAALSMPPLSGALATTAVTLDYAATQMDSKDTESYRIEAGSAEELSDGMAGAVRHILGQVDDYFHELEGALRELESVVDGLRQSDPVLGHSRLIPARPELVDGVGPEDFYHQTSDRGP